MRFFPLRSRTTATVSAIAFAAFVALVGLSPTAVGQPNYDNFWHVDDSAPPGGDGSSWPLAYRQLELAIAAADQAGGSNLIRVGQGTYSPSTTSADPRNATYVIDFNNVTIEGGYAGFGAPDPFERDVFTYVTTISGLIDYSPDAACGPGAGSCYSAHGTPGCDDVPCCEYICDDVDPFCCDVQWDDNCATTAVNLCPGNTYHVITFSNVDRTARIDGFVITSGSARGAQTQFGGAMLIGSVNSPASPTVVQCRFTDHAALRGGAAGVQISGSLPIFANCTFTGNTASQRGGAAYVNTGSAQFVNCLFWQNTAQSGQGGGINVEPNLRVELANAERLSVVA